MLLRFIDSSTERVDSAKSLIVDETHLVLVSGKLVQQKKLSAAVVGGQDDDDDENRPQEYLNDGNIGE